MAVSQLLVAVAALLAPTLSTLPSPPTPQTPDPATVRLDVSTPPAAAPGLAYLKGRSFVRRDGTTHALPRWYDEAYQLGRSTVALRLNRDGDLFVELVRPDSTVQWSRRTTGVVQSDDGRFVAWIAPSGQVHTMWPGGGVRLPTAPKGAQPTTISGVGKSCFEGRTSGCLVTL